MLDTQRLMEPTGPFFTLFEGDASALGAALAPLSASSDVSLHTLPGTQAGHVPNLMASFAQALALPDYFGANWDALDECLTDLEWLPSRRVILVFQDAGQVLREAREDLEVLVEILITNAEAWAEASDDAHPMSFHVVLQDRPEALEPWVQECLAQDIPFLRIQG